MNAPVAPPRTPALTREAQAAPASGIVEVANHGRGREGIIPLWVGEGDLATPAFICEAATRSLAAGETFYTWQRGIPELRQALARYHEAVYRRSFDPERFFVTQGGMHAIQIAVRMVAGEGDEVLVPTPAWPNFVGAVAVAGGRPVEVPMESVQGGWTLDVGRLEAALTPRTRALVVNSPSNPTGWTASTEELRALLAFARRHGLWILADEIYGRFVYDEALAVDGRAPSFKDVAEPEDRILYAQTFSKNWAMTGWRVGWLEADPGLATTIENLIQYSSSGTAVFLQRAGIAALEKGEGFVEHMIGRARRGRGLVCDGLLATGAVELARPPGGLYAFFRVKGAEDARALALRLIDEANVGLAPGTAFGGAGQGFLRLCIARRHEDLEEAVRRLAPVLQRMGG